MQRPCGTNACAEYVERCGGEPSSPSDYICWGCGMDGPMSWYYSQNSDNDGDDDDSDEE